MIASNYYAQALKVMNRVLRSGKQEVNFPISDLVRMLMFEDESDAADFTEQCGLEVWSMYRIPPVSLSMRKSVGYGVA